MCHFNADGRDNNAAGRLSVCLWTPWKVPCFSDIEKNVHIFVVKWHIEEKEFATLH